MVVIAFLGFRLNRLADIRSLQFRGLSRMDILSGLISFLLWMAVGALLCTILAGIGLWLDRRERKGKSTFGL
jgi:hypothetical protein